MTDCYVLIGDERYPASTDALVVCGLSHGDRVDSMETLERLMAAEHAAMNASQALYRAKLAALLGGPACA